MSSGFHRLGASAGKVIGWSNSRSPMWTADAGSPSGKAAVFGTAHPKPLTAPIMDYKQARQSGYTGDSCDTCGSMRVKISGHCTVCEACGSTSGCS